MDIPETQATLTQNKDKEFKKPKTENKQMSKMDPSYIVYYTIV